MFISGTVRYNLPNGKSSQEMLPFLSIYQDWVIVSSQISKNLSHDLTLLLLTTLVKIH